MLHLVLSLALSAAASKTAFLFQVTDSGGLCPEGPCTSEVTVAKDGRFVWKGVGGKVQRQGRIGAKAARAIAAAVAEMDFRAAKAKKFEGLCPTAYDGQERTYRFTAKKGVETLAACAYELDRELPLLKLADGIVADIFKSGPESR